MVLCFKITICEFRYMLTKKGYIFLFLAICRSGQVPIFPIQHTFLIIIITTLTCVRCACVLLAYQNEDYILSAHPASSFSLFFILDVGQLDFQSLSFLFSSSSGVIITLETHLSFLDQKNNIHCNKHQTK